MWTEWPPAKAQVPNVGRGVSIYPRESAPGSEPEPVLAWLLHLEDWWLQVPANVSHLPRRAPAGKRCVREAPCPRLKESDRAYPGQPGGFRGLPVVVLRSGQL